MKKGLKRVKRDLSGDYRYGLKEWKMFEISFFGSQVDELLNLLSRTKMVKGRNCWLTTVNTEFVMEARRNREFMDIINKSDIKLVDGIGLIWAREVLKVPRGAKRWLKALKVGREILEGKWRDEIITGADLIMDLAKMASKNGEKIFLLGGWQDRARESGEFLRKKFPGLKYEFCQGEPEVKNEVAIKKINDFGPDYLLVAYGMKKQEEWIEKNLDKLKTRVVVGVGRSFDYYSGALKRAPLGLRKMGLEWLYSLFKEPKRWRRQLVLPKFIWMVMSSDN